MHDLAVAAPVTLPPLAVCRRARRSRDPRFDGRFYVAVLSTGIYCRPTCPARLPSEANVRYFASAASAQDAGFRPCLRCRPEAAPALPEWTLSSATVLRALRLIEAGYLNHSSCAALAAQLGIGERHLSRLFAAQLGSAPKRVAQLVRARLARRLLASTDMRHTDIAFHAGYGSLSRFNSEIRSIYHTTPSALRKGGRSADPRVCMQLPVRLPYNFDWVFTYLHKRALKGIETVTRGRHGWIYQRRIAAQATVAVEQREDHLLLRLPVADEPLHSLLRRVRRVFDLDADGAVLHEDLRGDPRLGGWVQSAPGLRVVGAWDGFELAVRAILGQQVSVARSNDLTVRLIDAFGNGLFPAPEQLQDEDIAAIGMPGRRGEAVRALARRVASGELVIDECQDYASCYQALVALPGIGPWTANYVAMRALKDPNAFADNDWVVMKYLACSARQAREIASAWQPWRAYALMYLWYAAAQGRPSLNNG